MLSLAIQFVIRCTLRSECSFKFNYLEWHPNTKYMEREREMEEGVQESFVTVSNVCSSVIVLLVYFRLPFESLIPRSSDILLAPVVQLSRVMKLITTTIYNHHVFFYYLLSSIFTMYCYHCVALTSESRVMRQNVFVFLDHFSQ